MPNDVKLILGSDMYKGWETVSIVRTMEALTGSFSLTLADRFSVSDKPLVFHEQDNVELRIGDETILTGAIDAADPSVRGSTNISISGRDKTSDIVDCSARFKTDSFNKSTFSNIVSDLCSVYGIDVVIDTDLSGNDIKNFSINTGETVFASIEKLARAENVILITDPAGRLVITRAGTENADTQIIQGPAGNVLSAAGHFSFKDRYYKYIVRGSAAGNGKGTWKGATPKKGIVGESIDNEVLRTARTLIIKAESNSTLESVKARADWEKTIRKARGFAVSVSVQGWNRTASEIWKPNLIVPVKIPKFEIDERLLISEVTYNKSSSGTTTGLKLIPRETFTAKPVSETKRKKGGAW